MKLTGTGAAAKQPLVAPYMGAWIEISNGSQSKSSIDVAPFMGAWIEIDWIHQQQCWMFVAPYMGAWIEIINQWIVYGGTVQVAPYMGAWIEMAKKDDELLFDIKSPPSWVRGLKYDPADQLGLIYMVAPYMGAWITMYPADSLHPNMG